MRKFGVVMLETTLAAFALETGFSENIKTLTEAQKVQLRFNFIMARTKKAQGDAAKTTKGLANAMKAIGGLFADIAVDLGGALLPATEGIADAFRSLLTFVKSLNPAIKTASAGFLVLGTGMAGAVTAATTLAFLLPNIVAGFTLLKKIVPILKSVSAAMLSITVIAAAIVETIGLISLLIDTLEDVKAVRIRLGIDDDTGFFAAAGKAASEGFKVGIDSILSPLKAAGGDDITGEVAIDKKAQADKLAAERAARLAARMKELTFDFKEFDSAIVEANTEEAFQDLSRSLNEAIFDFGDTGNAAIVLSENLFTLSDPLTDISQEFGRLAVELENTTPQITDLGQAADDAISKGLGEFGNSLRKAGVGDQAASTITDSLSGAFAVAGPAIASAGDNISSTLDAVNKGLSTGGGAPAALAAVAADLILRTEGVQALFLSLDNVLGRVVTAIGPLTEFFGILGGIIEGELTVILEFITRVFKTVGAILTDLAAVLQGAIRPVMNRVNEILEILAPTIAQLAALLSTIAELFAIQVGPQAELLADALGVVAEVLKGVVAVITFVFRGIAGIFNGIINAISGVFRTIASFSILGKRPFGFLDSWADSLDRARISTDRFDSIMTGATSQVAAAGDAMCGTNAPTDLCAALNEMGSEINSVTSSLLNVPSGFRVALRRFQSTSTGTDFGAPAPISLGTGGTSVNIEVMNVDATDAENFARTFRETMEFENFSMNGSSKTASSPFAVNRKGS